MRRPLPWENPSEIYAGSKFAQQPRTTLEQSLHQRQYLCTKSKAESVWASCSVLIRAAVARQPQKREQVLPKNCVADHTGQMRAQRHWLQIGTLYRPSPSHPGQCGKKCLGVAKLHGSGFPLAIKKPSLRIRFFKIHMCVLPWELGDTWTMLICSPMLIFPLPLTLFGLLPFGFTQRKSYQPTAQWCHARVNKNKIVWTKHWVMISVVVDWNWHETALKQWNISGKSFR